MTWAGNVERVRLGSGPAIELSTSVAWYASSDEKGSEGLGNNPPSGAYIFRPNGETSVQSPQDVVIVQGPVLTEIHQVRYLRYPRRHTRNCDGNPPGTTVVTVVIVMEIHQVPPLSYS